MPIPKVLVAVGIVTGSALATTFAFAAWNSDGKGAATVAGKTAGKLQVTNVAIDNALYPGGSSDLSVKVKNPNPYAVTLTNINNDSAAAISATPSTCAASNVWFANQPVNVVLNSLEEKTITVPGVGMILNADNACQGAVFTIPVEVIGASSAGH
jgi:hypothetical protein